MADHCARECDTHEDERKVAPDPAKTGWNILVVDNDERTADLSHAVLKHEGYSVRTAHSAAQALKNLRGTPADLVLAELVMPRMDGIQLLAHIRELYPDTDVIILTGQTTLEDAIKALQRGAADFLPRPFAPRDLKRVVSMCLRAKRASRDRAFLTQSTSIVRLAQQLAVTGDTGAFLRQVVEFARENFEADAAILLRYEPADDALSVLAHVGATLSGWGRMEKLTDQAMLTIKQHNVVLSADVDSGDCYAYVPLIVSNRPRGVLCLRRLAGPWFREKSVGLLEIFATHMGLSMETVHLNEKASEQVYELVDIVNTGQPFSTAAGWGRIADQILQGIGRLTDAEVCVVLIANGSSKLFRTSPVLPENSDIHQAIQSKLSGILERPTALNRPTNVLRPGNDVGRRLASFVCAPLAAGQKHYGVVGAFSSRPNCFTTEVARRLSTLAGRAAAAMESGSTLESISSMYREAIEMIANLVDARYAYSYGHSRQVRTYAGELAEALRLPSEEVLRIEDGSLLHDIGKLCIPATVLNKPGSLTRDEFEIVTSHPIYGARMLRDAPHLADLVPIVRHHHEHYNGSGYPDGLKGEAIPLGARIVGLCDVFDALVSHRIYRSALDFKEARNIIAEGAGTQFDPELTDLFLSLPLEKLTHH